MQVSIETTSGLERRLTVGVPAERVESEVNNRLKKAAKNIRLDGFRPGKVPMKVIKQRYGAGVRQEVLGEAPVAPAPTPFVPCEPGLSHVQNQKIVMQRDIFRQPPSFKDESQIHPTV